MSGSWSSSGVYSVMKTRWMYILPYMYLKSIYIYSPFIFQNDIFYMHLSQAN